MQNVTGKDFFGIKYQVKMGITSKNWDYDMNADIRSGVDDGGRDHKSRDVAVLFLKGCGVPTNNTKRRSDGNYSPFQRCFCLDP